MFGVTGLHCDQMRLKNAHNSKRWAYPLSYGFWAFNWILGHLLGGVVFFGLIGWLGSNLPMTGRFFSLAVLAVVCLAAAFHQFKIIECPMPQLTRQVSRLWLTNLHKNIVALGYGFQLGSGVATRIKVATTYIVIGCAFCGGSFTTGAITGTFFGVSRAVLPVIFARNTASPDKSLVFALKFNSFDVKVQKLNGVALLISALALGFAALIPQIEHIIK